jgi:hypothetical protein
MMMIVVDIFTKDDESKWKKIENPRYIPTIGSKVFLGYAPPPTVEDVVYDYDHNMIIVKCYHE